MMELFHVLFIILSGATTSVECCKKNEKAFRCGSSKIVLEEVCQDVQRDSCTQYTIRCKCADGMSRSKRGDCVPKSQCLTQEEVREEEIRQNTERNNRLFRNAVMVVQSKDALHLLRISMETWIESLCVCMKSTFMASHLNSSDRTVKCYYRPQDPAQTVVFTVVESNGHVKITLRPEIGDQLLFDLRAEYKVLGADKTCILLKTGEHNSGKAYCMLWGVDNDEEKEEGDCFEALEKMCVKDNFFVWEHNDRCVQHDKLAQAALEALKNVVD